MSRREEAQPLVRCGAMPCPWDTCMKLCPHRIQGSGADVFPNTLCGFYSQPGPHATSKIAKATGIPPADVEEVEQSAMDKIRIALFESPELLRDPGILHMATSFKETA